MNSYSELLKDPLWQRRRLEILNRDGWKCCRCGNTRSTLHVHHKNGYRNIKPWEYLDDELETLCEHCHEMSHIKDPVFNIYLAGKIEKNCWRHKIVNGLRDCDATEGGNPIIGGAIFGKHNYTGPFFVGCDHGCCHGENTHGVGDATCSHDAPHIERSHVIGLCASQIRSCNLFFAWIAENDCYGTLAEIGFAAGLGKDVVIASPADQDSDELWFARRMASPYIKADSPEDGLKRAIQHVSDTIKCMQLYSNRV